MEKCHPLPLNRLQMLSSLKILEIFYMSNILSPLERESHTGYPLLVESITIVQSGANGTELTELLSRFPKLTKLSLSIGNYHHDITGLGVAISSSSSANKTQHTQAGQERQQETRGQEEEEITAATSVGGLLLLPPQLVELEISGFLDLSLLFSSSVDDDNTRGEGGLQRLHSLRSLTIQDCPKFLSSYFSLPSSLCFPFPTSLQDLRLSGVEGVETLEHLSNLTSLTSLWTNHCGDFRGEGMWHLLTQGCLSQLSVFRSSKFFHGLETSHDKELLSRSCKLQKLTINDFSGALAAPICSLIYSSLSTLTLGWNEELERFTKEQDEALRLLTSLQDLSFVQIMKLQHLPLTLHTLASIKKLKIWCCPLLPSMLPALPSSLLELRIGFCPSLMSLPKDGLPSSLRLLDVAQQNREELRRQCIELRGTIPVIKDYLTWEGMSF